jgi:hypothetical protein
VDPPLRLGGGTKVAFIKIEENAVLNADFWKAAVERAVKTMCQSLLTLWGAGVLDIIHVDLAHSTSIAAGAAVLSLLTSVVSLPVGPSGSPSVVDSHADGA